MLGKTTYSDAMGLGGQSISGFLNDADTETLRNKYYDTLESGLSAAAQPAEMDTTNVLLGGIIPSLAMALLTEGKALGFAGPAIQNVVETEQKRVDKQQAMDVEAKLKGAGIFGDELRNRQTLEAAAENKKAELAQRELDRQQREADSLRDSEDRRYQTGVMSADRRFMAEQNAGIKKDIAEARDERITMAKNKEMKAHFDKRAGEMRLGQQAGAVVALSSMLSGNPSTIKEGAVSTIAARLPGEVGNISVRERALFIPDSLPRRTVSAFNWLSGGGTGAFTKEVRDGLKEAAGIYENIVRSRIAAVRGEAKTYAESADVNALGESYLAGLPQNQAPSLNPAKTYTTPNGAKISGAEALQRYGNNPQAMQLLKENP